MDVVGLSPIEAGNLLLVLNTGLIIGSPLSGWLSDRVLGSRKGVVMAGLTAMAISLLVLTMGWTLGKKLLLGGTPFLFGLSAGSGIVMYAHIKELVPKAMAGMALTGINFFSMLGGGFFLHLMGWVIGHSGQEQLQPEAYRSAFLLGTIGLAAAFCIYLKTERR